MPQETTVARKRGRPRPSETKQRDAAILTLLRSGPRTRNQICKETGLATSIVYLSLDRLRRADLVKLCQGPVAERLWSTDVDGPCP
jgi:DNA-binding MarR family transcriptional regulator